MRQKIGGEGEGAQLVGGAIGADIIGHLLAFCMAVK